MLINALQIRVGTILEIEGDLFKVTWTQHVTPGKGVACMQTKMKNIVSGKNLEKRFRSADKVEKAEVLDRKMQYLYEDQDGYVFMDLESFDQLTLTKDLLGDGSNFIVEEGEYAVAFYGENPVGITLPAAVELKVTVAPPEVKKATASASLRPVELENGMTVNAPVFIKEGDIIKINTDSGEYIERVR